MTVDVAPRASDRAKTRELAKTRLQDTANISVQRRLQAKNVGLRILPPLMLFSLHFVVPSFLFVPETFLLPIMLFLFPCCCSSFPLLWCTCALCEEHPCSILACVSSRWCLIFLAQPAARPNRRAAFEAAGLQVLFREPPWGDRHFIKQQRMRTKSRQTKQTSEKQTSNSIQSRKQSKRPKNKQNNSCKNQKHTRKRMQAETLEN